MKTHVYRVIVTATLIGALVLGTAFPGLAYTYVWTPTFFTTYSGIHTYQSPLDTGFVSVIDSNNTPRNAEPSPHNGVDLSASTGTAVKAIFAGTVSSTGYNTSCGNSMDILISGYDNLYIHYCHLNSYAVSKGASVSAGQTVAYSGASGNVLGPHLHFAITSFRNGYQMTDNMWLYYENLASNQWNAGKDIEFYKHWRQEVDSFYIEAYAMDDQNLGVPYYPTGMTIFHKKSSETTWRVSSMLASSLYPTGTYYYCFSCDGNYGAGDWVDIVVRGNSTVPNLVDGYPYAFGPPYYNRPNENVNTWPTSDGWLHFSLLMQ